MKNVFFDIGANNGDSSIEFAKKNPQMIFFAFEPIPEMCKIIREKIINLNNYILIQKAVSNYNGTSNFNVCSIEQSKAISIARKFLHLEDIQISDEHEIIGWGNSSLLEFSEKSKLESPNFEWCTDGFLPRADFIVKNTIEVDVIRLDDFIEQNNITEIEYLHIDAQGSDLKVLEGLGDKIKIVKSGVMEAATKQDVLYKNQNMITESLKFLIDNNFIITEIEKNDPNGNEVNIYFSKKLIGNIEY